MILRKLKYYNCFIIEHIDNKSQFREKIDGDIQPFNSTLDKTIEDWIKQ